LTGGGGSVKEAAARSVEEIEETSASMRRPLATLVLALAVAATGAPPARAQLEGLPVIRGPELLVRSEGRPPWSLTGLVQRERVPVPGGRTRTEDFPCLVLRDASITETHCLDGEPLLWRTLTGSTFDLRADAGPTGRRYLLWGFAARPAAALRLELGNGRRVRLRLRRFPAELRSAARWFAWAPPRSDAVRRVALLDARGRALARLTETLPPAGVRGTYGLILDVPAPTRGTARVVAGPLPEDPRARLLMRRVGARLCAEIDRPNPEDPACGAPPRNADDSLIAARGTPRGDTVGGIVPPGVTEVVLSASIGDASVRVPTQPVGGLRVFLGQLPFSGLVDVRLLDAGGRTLEHTSASPAYQTSDAGEDATRPLRRGRAPGGERFVVRGDAAGLCVSLTTPGRVRPDGGGSTCGFDGVELLVPCRPRLAAVVAPAAGRRRLRVEAKAGRVFRGDIVRLPDGRRVWLAPVPSDAAPEVVAWRDQRGEVRRVGLGRVPRPEAQCGYTARPRS
jgi:hypothetical protein